MELGGAGVGINEGRPYAKERRNDKVVLSRSILEAVSILTLLGTIVGLAIW
jgi:hypothetical protein